MEVGSAAGEVSVAVALEVVVAAGSEGLTTKAPSSPRTTTALPGGLCDLVVSILNRSRVGHNGEVREIKFPTLSSLFNDLRDGILLGSGGCLAVNLHSLISN